MIVVMLVLLTTTALGVFAVHSTTFEIQASGHARQGMQSQYLAETGLNAGFAMMDRMGPRALLYSIEQQQELGFDKPTLSPYEPDLADDKSGYRMYLRDLESFGTGLPVDVESIGGNRQPYGASFVVDVNDHYTYTGAMEGNRSDGYGRLQYLHATYTSRGRLRIDSARVGFGDTTSVSADLREFHEAATDARAHGVSGPFGR